MNDDEKLLDKLINLFATYDPRNECYWGHDTNIGNREQVRAWTMQIIDEFNNKAIKKERAEIIKEIIDYDKKLTRMDVHCEPNIVLRKTISIIKLRSETSTVVKPELHSKARD